MLRPVEFGVVGMTRVGVDTAEVEDADAESGKEFLITGAGLTVASGTVWS